MFSSGNRQRRRKSSWLINGTLGVLNLCLALWRRGRDPKAFVECGLKEKKEITRGSLTKV